MKTIQNILFLGMLLLFSLSSCGDNERESVDLSANVDIKSFSINGTQGVIDASKLTITVMMPTGTDLSNLTAAVEIPEGAELSPASGTAIDYRYSDKTPIEYHVMNGNIYNKYKVIVKEIKAEITSFVIGSRTGIIDQEAKTVLIYVPDGSDITQLTPIVRYTDGATITPADGLAVDFSNSVTYTLSYLGNTFSYVVSVIIGNEPVLPLVIYNGEDIVPQWWTVGSAGDISSNFANPKSNALNSTPYCASIWRNPGDDDWTGGGLGGLNIDPTVYDHFTLLVWKEYAGDVQLEIQGDGADNQRLKVRYLGDALGEWQKLEFSLPEGHGLTKIHAILVAPQITGTKDDPNFLGHRMYWDQLIANPQ
ncbi:MAG: hypothetical protein EZS26_003161 [Candidatus Ordinivivax streblomastigis]|uniref:DUF1735 domain-containing protein n=1 Tax=Candidatus Ordinivivax streblomastigis TaxID=2540710 RepID=A0A5M8NWD1_9BACT|nr:MAG: hypothetical protein EZS26_003161 [Candidatus Ordinivivax streblomastigis]